MRNIRILVDLLTKKERNRALLLLCMIIIMAILEMIGVASIMPFMAVLANPVLVDTNKFLYAFYKKFNFSDRQNFLFALGVLVFMLLLVSLAFKALTTYAQLRFTQMREFSIGTSIWWTTTENWYS